MATQLAAQLYTVRDFAKTPEDLAATLAKVKKIGYDAVQVSGICAIEYTDLKKLLADNGLICCATHISYDKMKNETQKVIDEHHTINCKYAAIGALPTDYRNPEGYLRFAKEANEVARKLYEGGVVFGYHNHAIELEKCGEKTGLDAIYDNTDAECFTAEVDTYWIHHGGCDIVEWIDRLKGRIPLVHLKDMTVDGNDPIYAEVGEGNFNWKKILDACRRSGVEWYIVEQDECRRDPFESLKISFDNLRAMGIS